MSDNGNSNGNSNGNGNGNGTLTGEVDTVRCTAFPCEQVKRSSNNWYIVWSDDPAGMFHCVDYTREMFQAVGDQARAVCGPACGQRLFEKFLSGKKI